MRYFIKNKLIYFSCLLCFQLIFSQVNPVKNITTLNGLPNNSIYSLKKDSRGLLWIGTGAGVSKIANDKITNFYEEDGLAYNNCWAIEEDSNKNLWFGSYGGGLTFYDGSNFSIFNTVNGLVNNRIRKLFYYKEKLFVGTKNGLSVIDINSKKIKNPVYRKKSRLQIMGFFEFENTIYIQTYVNGLWKYNEKKNELVFLHNNFGGAFSVYKKKKTLLVSYDGFEHKNKSIKEFNIQDYINGVKPIKEIGNSVFWGFTKDKNQNIYGVADGINYPTGGIYKLLDTCAFNQNTKFNINSTKQWSIDYDKKDDNLLLGTLDKGVFEVALNENIIYSNTIKNIIEIESKENTTYFLTKNKLIIKKDKIKKDISKHEFYLSFKQFFKNKEDVVGGLSIRFKESVFDDLEFKSIKKIDDIIWINTTIGLFKLSKHNTIDKYYPIYTDVFFFTSKDDAFFQRPYVYLHYIKNIENNPINIIFEPTDKNNPKDIVAVDSINNKLYFSSKFTGLYQYQNGKFTSFLKNNIWQEKELTHSMIYKNKKLAISNSRGSVFIADVSNGFKISKIINRKEIIGETILFLKSYDDYLIIGTEKGINLYKDGTIIFLDEEQGVSHKNFTSALIKNDNLLVGTTNGYYTINLEATLKETNTQSYDFNVSNIKINFKNINSTNYNWFQYKNKSIELPYNKNTISFTYHPKNHPYPNKLKYRYKTTQNTKHIWSEWIYNNYIQFYHLSSGNYNIQLEVKDYSNGKTYKQSLINIIVPPPYWKTWWFISSIITLVLFIFYLIYKFKIGQIKNKEQQKQKALKRVSATKIEALQSQMNPHFIFNAMNSIQNFIIDNDVDNSLKYMGEFSKLIRKTLNNSSIQSIPLSEEISYLKTYIELENLRFQSKIKTTIVTNNLDIENIVVPPMLLQPIIENVFKHAFNNSSENPTLIIDFNQKKDVLICKITDNGKGLDPNFNVTKHQSKGIKLIKERLELLNLPSDAFLITSNNPEGTVATITLKIDTLNK